MRNKVQYEWCVEMTDRHGDIIDAQYYDKLSELELKDFELVGDLTPVLVLIRDVGNQDDGLQDRTWCYPNFLNGKASINERFQCSYQQDREKVTQKHKKEFESWATKQGLELIS